MDHDFGMPDVLVDDEVGEETELAPRYKVLLHNDNVNTIDHVIYALQEVFGFSEGEAVGIAFEAHNSGVALCKVEFFEHAEYHCNRLRSHGLDSTIEPDE